MMRIAYSVLRGIYEDRRNTFYGVRTLIALLVLVGCAGRTTPTPYVPPTLAPTSPLTAPETEERSSLSTEAIAFEEPETTPTPACTPDLAFLDDLTIPDGALVGPEMELDKRWQVENSGTCNWDAGYRLKLIAGPDMGAAPEQALYPARSGSQAPVRILFVAPEEAGVYRSAWQAFDPRGEPFGDPIFIEILVQEEDQSPANN